MAENAKEKIVFENDLGLPNFFILKINYQTYFFGMVLANALSYFFKNLYKNTTLE
jgi:hypothetical protein